MFQLKRKITSVEPLTEICSRELKKNPEVYLNIESFPFNNGNFDLEEFVVKNLPVMIKYEVLIALEERHNILTRYTSNHWKRLALNKFKSIKTEDGESYKEFFFR